MVTLLKPGARARTQPWTDEWIQGDIFGTVQRVGQVHDGRRGQVLVALDRSKRALWFNAEDVEMI